MNQGKEGLLVFRSSCAVGAARVRKRKRKGHCSGLGKGHRGSVAFRIETIFRTKQVPFYLHFQERKKTGLIKTLLIVFGKETLGVLIRSFLKMLEATDRSIYFLVFK